VSNKITTAKYNQFTFVPKAALVQFTRVITLFFTVNVILQCFPEIATNSPAASAFPVFFICVLGMIREGIADNKRHREDKRANKVMVRKLKKGSTETEEIMAQDLKVGDVISIKDEEFIPADCFLLNVAKNENGQCFI
jgi:magnesium-transporting ATPase (P-type)